MGRVAFAPQRLPKATRAPLALVLCLPSLASLSCAHEGTRARHDEARPGSAAIDEARRDRAALSSISALLGEPLPSPAADDEVGVEQPAFDVTRAFAASPPRLGGRPTRMRLTAWRGRVHTAELTFAERCDASCARSLVATLEAWAGPLDVHQEGRARFLSAGADTVQVTLEVYPAKPELTRVILRCGPLWSVSQGRPSRLPGFGELPVVEPRPRCRPLPP